MAPCPHLQKISVDQCVKRFGVDFQEDYRSQRLACFGSCDGKADLWACFHCDVVACGRGVRGHMVQHYEEKQHPICVNISNRVVWCYICDDELTDDRDQTGEQETTKLSDNTLILREIRSRLDISKSIDEGEVSVQTVSDDLDEDDLDIFEDESGRTKTISSSRGLCGLDNVGNTCYLNAAVQALSNCKPLSLFFRRCPAYYARNDKQDTIGKARLVQHFAELINQMWSGKQKILAPHSIVRDIIAINPVFRGYAQQDSQEFLRSLLSSLHDELKMESKYKRPEEDSEEGSKQGSTAASEATASVSPMMIEKTEKEKHPKKGHKKNKSSSSVQNGDGSEASLDLRKVNGSVSSMRTNISNTTEKEAAAKSAPVRRYFSIISDTFEGSILSEVTCSSCKRVFQKEDPVYELSVSIPSKRQRQRMAADKQDRVPTTPQQQAGASSKELKTPNGWISSLTNLFSREQSKSISLQDCLHSYCGTEELNGDDKYKCDKCKAVCEATKKLTLLKLPEILVIHIKRFRYDSYFGTKLTTHVMFPLEDLDLRPFMQKEKTTSQSKYDLFAVVRHHGMLNGGHYTAFAKNQYTERWYEFDDREVRSASREDVLRTEAYMLFYERKRAPNALKYRRRVESIMKGPGNSEGTFYISWYWFVKFRALSDPGPIDNSEFLCEHGNVNVSLSTTPDPAPDNYSNVHNRTRRIPESVWKMLVSIYGGGPPVRDLVTCPACLEEQRQLRARREQEKRAIQESDKTYVEPGECWYIIDSKWLNQWRDFALEDKTPRRPGPISNDRLLLPDGRPKPGLQKAKDYRGVNSKVWKTFFGIYGGGPAILRTALDIYSDAPSRTDSDEETEDRVSMLDDPPVRPMIHSRPIS